MSVSEEIGGVELATAVRLLRSEIETAIVAAAEEDVLFDVGQIELEFQVAVTKGGKGEAGAKFWVVSVGGEVTYSRELTHTIKLTLIPHHRGSTKNIRVSDDDCLN